jgi:hypothetical protein
VSNERNGIMASDLFDEDEELTAEEAFLFSLDDAIAATVHCLSAAGCDEDEIWAAFRKAINIMCAAAADVEVGEFTARYLPVSKAA